MDLKQHIRHVPDFPKPGILFYDITTLLRDPVGLKVTIDRLSTPYTDQGIDVVVGIESRGFILGAAVAERIGAGFIPIRKPGKLPARAIKETYDLEYGTDALEIHADAVEKGQRVLIVDEVWDSGTTIHAVTERVLRAGGFPTTAVLHYKPEHSKVPGRPDVHAVETNAWVVYPFKAGG